MQQGNPRRVSREYPRRADKRQEKRPVAPEPSAAGSIHLHARIRAGPSATGRGPRWGGCGTGPRSNWACARCRYPGASLFRRLGNRRGAGRADGWDGMGWHGMGCCWDGGFGPEGLRVGVSRLGSYECRRGEKGQPRYSDGKQKKAAQAQLYVRLLSDTRKGGPVRREGSAHRCGRRTTRDGSSSPVPSSARPAAVKGATVR